MAPFVTQKKKKAARTHEQRKLSKANSDAMWANIESGRMKYIKIIESLAEKYNMSADWMSGQMYLGGKLLKRSRSAGVFNAFVRRKMHERKDNDEDDLLREMQDEKEMKANIKVTGREAGIDIENTLARVQPELLGLEKRTGCNMMWILTCSKISNSFIPRSYTSEPLQTAFLHLYKSTIESVGMQTDAYITSGAAGVVKMTTGCSATKLRTQVQEMIQIGMHEILTKKKGVSEDSVPSVAYNSYDAFIVKWGVELSGWTEGEVRNPGTITSSIGLAHLHAALKNEECYWRELTPDEWEAKKELFEQQVLNGTIKGCTTRSDKEDKQDDQENRDEEQEKIDTQKELNCNRHEDTCTENDATMIDEPLNSLGGLPASPLLDPFDREALHKFLKDLDLPYEP
ncbi:hypothetical protein BD769DRAFT_1673829 [Suillus cothurnatus]|nr:hypothetical protein BD769DRAFT_1673829 [Suillus cothurnatus]